MRRISVVATFAAVLAWGGSAKAQGTCSHDECEVGGPLTEDCSVCAEAVCGSDAYCCAEEWDDECVELADFLCNWCGGDGEGTSDTGSDDRGDESSGDDGADGNDDGDDSPGPGDDDDDDDSDDDDDDSETGDDEDEDRGKNDKNDEPGPGGPVAPVARGGDAQGCSIGSGHDRGLALLGFVLWLGVARRRRS